MSNNPENNEAALVDPNEAFTQKKNLIFTGEFLIRENFKVLHYTFHIVVLFLRIFVNQGIAASLKDLF